MRRCPGSHAGEIQVALVLNSTALADVLVIAENNERMPRKSTYFYPKPGPVSSSIPWTRACSPLPEGVSAALPAPLAPAAPPPAGKLGKGPRLGYTLP